MNFSCSVPTYHHHHHHHKHWTQRLWESDASLIILFYLVLSCAE